jgi:hypothetical protein
MGETNRSKAIDVETCGSKQLQKQDLASLAILIQLILVKSYNLM